MIGFSKRTFQCIYQIVLEFIKNTTEISKCLFKTCSQLTWTTTERKIVGGLESNLF